MAFSALTFFHSLGGAGEDLSVGTREPPAFETRSDRREYQAGGIQKS